MIRKTLCLILCLAFFLTCGPKQNKVEKIVEDGVEVVINHLEPYTIEGIQATLALEEEFIIDFEREDFAKLGLTDLWGFEIDSEGNIYILHFRSKENIVFKFDRNGEYICSFGKKGLGPDEIQYASFSRIHLWPRINAEDRIVITDSRGKKLLIFDKDGSLLKNIKLELNFEAAVPINAETYLVLKKRIGPQAEYLEYPLSLFSSDFKELKELHSQKWINWTRANRISAIPQVMSLHVTKRNIFLWDSDKGYELLVYNLNGELIRKIRKDYQPVEFPKEIKENLLKYALPDDSFQHKNYFPPNWPPIQYFFTDEEGRLFVMTYEEGKSQGHYIHDVISPEGIFIGRISLGNFSMEYYKGKPLGGLALDVRARDNRLYCLREKESGYKELVVYKTRWE